jgi:hypothetical protein
LPRCPEACGNFFNLDLTLNTKVLRTLGPRGATLTDHVCAPSNVFRAAVYDSIGRPLPFMIVNSGTRWLPEPETFGSKSGRVCRPKAQTGQQPQSFGRRPNGGRALSKSRVIGRLKLLKSFHNRMVGLGRAHFFYVALLILTTDRGRSLRGVVTTKPGGHVVRARSSSTVFSETPVSASALTSMSVGTPARARQSSWMFAGTFRNSSSAFIPFGAK